MMLDIKFIAFCILMILTIVGAFSLLYYAVLYIRYKRKCDLILKENYLNQLFKQSESSTEASRDTNGDLSIETVIFEQKDFQFSEELKKIAFFFNHDLSWERNYDR